MKNGQISKKAKTVLIWAMLTGGLIVGFGSTATANTKASIGVSQFSPPDGAVDMPIG